MVFTLKLFLSESAPSAATVSMGGPEEDQRFVLGLGGHESLHQQQPALVARRAQRLGFLRLPGGTPGVGAESQSMHGHCARPHLRKSYRWASRCWGIDTILILFIFYHHYFVLVQETPARVPGSRVRSPARCTAIAATAPARLWSACGAAAHSAASTPPLTSSPSRMASVWSGRLESVSVRNKTPFCDQYPSCEESKVKLRKHIPRWKVFTTVFNWSSATGFLVSISFAPLGSLLPITVTCSQICIWDFSSYGHMRALTFSHPVRSIFQVLKKTIEIHKNLFGGCWLLLP